jgi:cytidine deaminase
MTALSESNQQLLETAEEALSRHYNPQKHTTAVALRTGSGEIYTGISLKAGTSAEDVHAEPIAVGRAVLNGESSFETVVAVQYSDPPERPGSGNGGSATQIASPCGGCREALARQAPDVSVILPESEGPVVKTLSEIHPY